MAETTDEFKKSKEAKDEKGGGGWRVLASGLVLALLTAILTGAISYAYGVANDIRKAKLDFVNAQIEKLYGPVFASSQAGRAIWNLFVEFHWRNQDDPQDGSPVFFDDSNPPNVDQVRRWRHWMRTVFQPLNLKMEEAMVANSHLLIGDTLPPAFQDLIAHTEAYKAVIATWTADDFSECEQRAPRPAAGTACPAVTALRNTASIRFPQAAAQCVADDYEKLKRRQQELQSGLILAFFAGTVTRSPACDDTRLRPAPGYSLPEHTR
jgi:hypothetical protein